MFLQVEEKERDLKNFYVMEKHKQQPQRVEATPVELRRVSLFDNAFSSSKGDADIVAFLTTDQYKRVINEIRATTDTAQIRRLKTQLPAITPAGVFRPTRQRGNIVSYSAMACIDIDGKDNPIVEDWSVATHRIGSLSPCVLYAGLSASGRGCFVIYRIATPQRYAEHYASIIADLQDVGLKADAVCCDISRLRFASYDPTPYLNEQAIPHYLPDNTTADTYQELQTPIKQSGEFAKSNICLTLCTYQGETEIRSKSPNNAILQHRVGNAVQAIVEQGINIAEDYFVWYRIGCALASTFGERGRWMYHAISAQSHKYQFKECDKQYARCMASQGIGIGTLLHYLKMAGVRW